jgi:B12-binding domain/radical SAM domain protein
MQYDVILIHPPAIYNFWEKEIFYGPIALSVPESTRQFIIPPVGMLSIADYLDRNGYKAVVDNMGDRMIASEKFDAEAHIAKLSAKVFAIGLHWCVHCQGAIEIARLCKKLHPDAMVVLGGLTSTVFHDEILRKFNFVDAVIRGEAEKPFLSLLKAMEGDKNLQGVPNLSFRDAKGEIQDMPLMNPCTDLDEFEFTRLDLMEPQGAVFPAGKPSHWAIPVCRGCLHHCVGCGGSAYSYATYLGRKKPAFRSPEKRAQDIRRLSEQGVERVFLFQDPRMGGKEYWSKLLTTLQNEKIKLDQLTMEIFGPATEEYIAGLSKIGVPIVLTISPESCVESVRKAHGRNYSNHELFRTIELCKKYNISIGVFSMIALAEDTPKTIRETWKIWEEICSLDQKSKGQAPANYGYGPMILLDPGSQAFDSPKTHGYRLRFKNLEDYIKGMSLPSWHQWISYETRLLDRDSITRLVIDSIEHSIHLREKYGSYTTVDADMARLYYVFANKLAIDVVNNSMALDEVERMDKLRLFRESLDGQLRELAAQS